MRHDPVGHTWSVKSYVALVKGKNPPKAYLLLFVANGEFADSCVNFMQDKSAKGLISEVKLYNPSIEKDPQILDEEKLLIATRTSGLKCFVAEVRPEKISDLEKDLGDNLDATNRLNVEELQIKRLMDRWLVRQEQRLLE